MTAEQLIDRYICEVSNDWLTKIKATALKHNGYAPVAKKDGALVSFDSSNDLQKFLKDADKLIADYASKGKDAFVTEKLDVGDTDGPWTQW